MMSLPALRQVFMPDTTASIFSSLKRYFTPKSTQSPGVPLTANVGISSIIPLFSYVIPLKKLTEWLEPDLSDIGATMRTS